jgi:hypothetical protein
MEGRTIRITIELPEGLVGSPKATTTVEGTTGVITQYGDDETAFQEGPSSPPSGVGTTAASGMPIDAGAPSPDLVAALGGEAGPAGLAGRYSGTEGDGTDSGAVGGVSARARDERAIDAGPLPDYVATLLESGGPRHPMADPAEFRAALSAENRFDRN